MQKIERIDVRDAASAIASLIKTDYRQWKSAYNVGHIIMSVLELAEAVKKNAKERFNLDTEIQVVSAENLTANFGMDSSLLKQENWTPKYGLDDIIVSLFDYLKQ